MLASKWAPKPVTSEPKATETAPASASPPPPETQQTAEVQANAQPDALPVDSEYAPQPPDASYDYNYTGEMDPFAQTASTDDLFFDDDFTPIAEPVVEPNPVEVPPPAPIPQDLPPTGGLAQSQHSHHAQRGHADGERGGRGRGKGRGRGRGRGGNQVSEGRVTHDIRKEENKEVNTEEIVTPDSPSTAIEEPDYTATATDTPSTPTGPKAAPGEKPTHSVRGDRTLTGGTPRARLTPAQLDAKVASMRSKNQTLTAAHARAERDAANFEAREAVAAEQDVARKKQTAERQRQDRQNRQQMMGERERNRQRKLEAKGRAWDEEKEEGFSGTGEERRRGAGRGMHGGASGMTRTVGKDEGWGTADAAQDENQSPPGGGRGRGRGGGGRAGRGAGGRGGRGDHTNPPTHQFPPKPSDFPDLPASSSAPAVHSTPSAPKKLDFPLKTKTADLKATETTSPTSERERPGIKKTESFGLTPLSPSGAGKSWADQVEGS